MALMKVASGHSPEVARLVRALGITFPCEKVVLEMSVKSRVMLYVVAPACVDQLERLSQELEGVKVVPCLEVSVTDKGEVQHSPLPPYQRTP